MTAPSMTPAAGGSALADEIGATLDRLIAAAQGSDADALARTRQQVLVGLVDRLGVHRPVDEMAARGDAPEGSGDGFASTAERQMDSANRSMI